jgi:hypothetical protein
MTRGYHWLGRVLNPVGSTIAPATSPADPRSYGPEQRLLELPTLLFVHLRQRRVADDLLDAAA